MKEKETVKKKPAKTKPKQPETKIGRKIKLTPALIAAFVQKLSVGVYAKYAARSEGVAEKSYYNWLERGANAEKLHDAGKKVPETEKLFLQFLQSVRQAEANANVVLTTMVYSKGREDWKAAMEMLARKWPEDWAKKDFLDFKGSIDTGPDKTQEAIKEYEEAFDGMSTAEIATIIQDTNRKIREAKNNSKKIDNIKQAVNPGGIT